MTITYQNSVKKWQDNRKVACLQVCYHKFVLRFRHVNAFEIWSMEKSISLVYIQPKTKLVKAITLYRLKCKCKCKISTESSLQIL